MKANTQQEDMLNSLQTTPTGKELVEMAEDKPIKYGLSLPSVIIYLYLLFINRDYF